MHSLPGAPLTMASPFHNAQPAAHHGVTAAAGDVRAPRHERVDRGHMALQRARHHGLLVRGLRLHRRLRSRAGGGLAGDAGAKPRPRPVRPHLRRRGRPVRRQQRRRCREGLRSRAA